MIFPLILIKWIRERQNPYLSTVRDYNKVTQVLVKMCSKWKFTQI